MPEYKSTPHFVKSISDRTVIGLFAIHGNRDDGGDRSHPGAFADTLIRGRDRCQFLWQHNSWEPPIAAITYIREISRSDLPEAVLSYAPDATGAAEVARTYLDTARGDEVLKGIIAGAIDEMSYMYDVLQYTITTDEESSEQTRELYKLRLWDVSDVNWGMNIATMGSKEGSGWKARPLLDHAAAVEAALREWTERIAELKERRSKEGRTFSSANSARIGSIAESLLDAGKDLQRMLAESEPKQQQHAEVQRLYLETQRLLAQLNGVSL